MNNLSNVNEFLPESWTREALQMQEDEARDLYLELRKFGLHSHRAVVAATLHQGFVRTAREIREETVRYFREQALCAYSDGLCPFYARCAGVRLAAEQIGDITR